MKKYMIILLATVILAGGWAPQSRAALQAVGPTNAANGYPIWYEDTNALRLEACLDQTGFCLAVPPLPGPIVFPTNFPDEFFYWSATALIDAPAVSDIPVLLVLALEGAFANGPVVAGDQVVFARIRYRFRPTVTGNYTLTHPYGQITVAGTAGVVATATQDIGIAPGIFTGALADSNAGGIVNADGRSIGPFLSPATAPFTVLDPVSGNTYLANPGSLIAVTGSPLGTNFFSIVGPGGTATQTLFGLEGKVSGCLAGNLGPTAVADAAAIATSATAVMNLTANDTPGANASVVPINPHSVVITVPPANGNAVKNTDGTVTYTPNPTFFGLDSFTYTAQDMCGLTSNAVAVPLTVEDLKANKAEFRARTGKWTVEGSSSTTTANTITLRKGPGGPVIGTTQVQSDGKWKFKGKSKVSPQASTPVHVESAIHVFVNEPLNMK